MTYYIKALAGTIAASLAVYSFIKTKQYVVGAYWSIVTFYWMANCCL